MLKNEEVVAQVSGAKCSAVKVNKEITNLLRLNKCIVWKLLLKQVKCPFNHWKLYSAIIVPSMYSCCQANKNVHAC